MFTESLGSLFITMDPLLKSASVLHKFLGLSHS